MFRASTKDERLTGVERIAASHAKRCGLGVSKVDDDTPRNVQVQQGRTMDTTLKTLYGETAVEFTHPTQAVFLCDVASDVLLQGSPAEPGGVSQERYAAIEHVAKQIWTELYPVHASLPRGEGILSSLALDKNYARILAKTPLILIHSFFLTMRGRVPFQLQPYIVIAPGCDLERVAAAPEDLHKHQNYRSTAIPGYANPVSLRRAEELLREDIPRPTHAYLDEKDQVCLAWKRPHEEYFLVVLSKDEHSPMIGSFEIRVASESMGVVEVSANTQIVTFLREMNR